MSVGEWFRTFCSNIEVRNDATISSRFKGITQRLDSQFWGIASDAGHGMYVGSYGRSTAIRGLRDVEMVFELPDGVLQQYDTGGRNAPSALLEAVGNSARRGFPLADAGVEADAVGLRFPDGMVARVTPVFLNEGGSYRHPDCQGGTWRTIDPRVEIAAMRERDAACDGNLVALCRMMRAWRNKWAVPMDGLLVDTLAYLFMGQWKYKAVPFDYYDCMCRDFLEYLSNQDTTQENWPAPGSAECVARKGVFEEKARSCCVLSLEAMRFGNDKKDWSARQKWRGIFGSLFPEI